MITANVIADSIGKLNSIRVTTLELVLGAQHAPTNFRGYLQYRRVVEAQMEKAQE